MATRYAYISMEELYGHIYDVLKEVTLNTTDNEIEQILNGMESDINKLCPTMGDLRCCAKDFMLEHQSELLSKEKMKSKL